MAEQINATTALHQAPLESALDSLLTDVTNLRTAFNTLVTKLNADTGVGDSNYAADTALVTTT